MKANEAPENVYLAINVFGDIIKDQWQFHRLRDDDIEYTRTDAFIEKVKEFLSNESNIPLWEGYNGDFGCDTPKLVENFIKYMEGE